MRTMIDAFGEYWRRSGYRFGDYRVRDEMLRRSIMREGFRAGWRAAQRDQIKKRKEISNGAR